MYTRGRARADILYRHRAALPSRSFWWVSREEEETALTDRYRRVEELVLSKEARV